MKRTPSVTTQVAILLAGAVFIILGTLQESWRWDWFVPETARPSWTYRVLGEFLIVGMIGLRLGCPRVALGLNCRLWAAQMLAGLWVTTCTWLLVTLDGSIDTEARRALWVDGFRATLWSQSWVDALVIMPQLPPIAVAWTMQVALAGAFGTAAAVFVRRRASSAVRRVALVSLFVALLGCAAWGWMFSVHDFRPVHWWSATASDFRTATILVGAFTDIAFALAIAAGGHLHHMAVVAETTPEIM